MEETARLEQLALQRSPHETARLHRLATAYFLTGRASEALNRSSLAEECMVLIFLTQAWLVARAFWLQGEGNPEQIEGALLERGRRRDFLELDRRI